MLKAYRMATRLVAPLIPLWLVWRGLQGKEDRARLGERYGVASKVRPLGMLLWIHAASVGEANSVLLLIGKLRQRFPDLQILMTTGTVTSARLMGLRLPKGALHQYAPVDTPQATWRFIRHWRPDIAFFVESELWPNLIAAANEQECFLGLINARMSERSFVSWQKRPAAIRQMLSCFDIVCAQSEADAERLKALGARETHCVGNLKYDAALLPCDEAELLRLKDAVGARPVWLAASTHPGEERQIARAHELLAATRPHLLTIIVPRHPSRGSAIAQEMGKSALRSKQQPLTDAISFYIADTMGELGLFYRLCPIVFMGGSLVAHGGQNPLEPARLSCAIIAGPHTHNFAGIYQEMEAIGGLSRVGNAAQLAAETGRLLSHPDILSDMQRAAKIWLESKNGASDRLLAMLSPIFDAGRL